ncbi:MAG: LysR family transcriptional regulator [Betaproteobacteria bacterium]
MSKRLLDLQLLQMFVVTAEERSMSAAAQRLGTTQSAISQGVRKLEEQLGVVLFNRQHRPLSLTPPAQALLNRGRALLADSAQIRSEVLEAESGIAPEVTIGLVDSFAATCGPSFIKRMLGQTVRLAVRTGLTPHQREQFLARELDIVVTTDPFESLERKVNRRLFSESFIVLNHRQSRAQLYSRDALHELAAASPLIRFNAQSHLGQQVEALVRSLGLRAARRLEVDTADTQVAMVAAGLGWAITTPSCLVQGQQHAGGVSVGALHGVRGGRSVYVVGREGEHDKLFRSCFDAALHAVHHTLVPAWRAVAPQAGPCIEAAEPAEPAEPD